MRKYIILLLLLASTTSFAQVHEQLLSFWRDSVAHATESVIRDSVVVQGSLRMPLFWTIYGDEPADGRSLWISLHGGGGVPAAVNDGQWRNQKYLYKPEEGVYVAPRAPWNAWDMWCQAPIDSMYLEIIKAMVTHYNVNPDKVHLLGYSAGGDGVWRMAPRMADHWASASMMAGHPGDVSLVNLHSLPFMIWMGGLDAAYDRNRLAAVRGAEMDSLQAHDRDGYVHETHILADKGHWMDHQDTLAIAWLAKYRRQPWPRHLVWQQEEVLKESFYWVSVPASEMQRGKRVEITVKGSVIDIKRCDYTSLTLRLCDELLPLDGKIKIRHNGKTVYKGKVTPCDCHFFSTLRKLQDPRMAAPVELTLNL